MSFFASKWHQHRIARLFLDLKPNLIVKRARLAVVKQNVLNIELFKKCDITHPLSHFVTKVKDPHNLLRDVIFALPLTSEIPPP